MTGVRRSPATRLRTAAALLALLVVAACSRSDTDEPAGSPPPAARAETTSTSQQVTSTSTTSTVVDSEIGAFARALEELAALYGLAIEDVLGDPTVELPPTQPAPPPADTPPSSTAPPNPAAPDDDRRRPEHKPSSSGAVWLFAGGGALVLVASLAVRSLQRRRRRSSRQATAQSAGEPIASADAFDYAKDVPIVHWARHKIACLTGALEPSSVSSGPVLVEVSEAFGIEMLWESQQHRPPPPWTEADEGWAWHLPYNASDVVPREAAPATIPALVTIGQREDRQLLLDLEAFGTIAIEGPDDLVDRWLQGVAMELAAGEGLRDTQVLLLGAEPIAKTDGLRTTSDSQLASREVIRWLRRSDEVLVRNGWTDTLAARMGGDVPVGVGVLVTFGTTSPDLVVVPVPPRHGAVIVGRNVGGAAAHIVIAADGMARLDPLGVEFVALRPEVGSPCAATATAAMDGGVRTLLPTAVAMDIVQAAANDDPDEPRVADAEPQLVVRVLGTPSVMDRPSLGRREIAITAFIACRGGPVAASAVQDAVWGGRAIESKTLWNLIGRTRRALGELPDGSAVMPSADRARGTLSLAEGVVTDLELLRRAVQDAETSSSGRAGDLLWRGLRMVDGPPFDDAGYDWAFRDQLVHEASVLIESAVEHIVDLAIERGELDEARDAITHGLRGLPGDERLYRLRMRTEHSAGNVAAVKAAFDELALYLADFDGEPSEETTDLCRLLVSRTLSSRA